MAENKDRSSVNPNITFGKQISKTNPNVTFDNPSSDNPLGDDGFFDDFDPDLDKSSSVGLPEHDPSQDFDDELPDEGIEGDFDPDEPESNLDQQGFVDAPGGNRDGGLHNDPRPLASKSAGFTVPNPKTRVEQLLESPGGLYKDPLPPSATVGGFHAEPLLGMKERVINAEANTTETKENSHAAGILRKIQNRESGGERGNSQ